MRLWLTAFSAALIGAAALTAPSLAQETAPGRLLPLVKSLNLRVTPPGPGVPEPCRKFAGAFAGQFSDGPYANLVITDVTAGPGGCVFRGTYGWSAYSGNPQPGTTNVGPGTFMEGRLTGGDLKLGDLNNMGMVVHPDLRAEFYMQGSVISHAILSRIAAAPVP